MTSNVSTWDNTEVARRTNLGIPAAAIRSMDQMIGICGSWPQWVSHARTVTVSPQEDSAFSCRNRCPASLTVIEFPFKDRTFVNGNKSAKKVYDFRIVSGLKWDEIASLLRINERDIFSLLNGHWMSRDIYDKLEKSISVVRYIDTGSGNKNRKILMKKSYQGQTFLQLLRRQQYDLVRRLAEEGDGRPQFDRHEVTQEQWEQSAPRHLGKDILEASSLGNESDITPLRESVLNRVKTRPMKA